MWKVGTAVAVGVVLLAVVTAQFWSRGHDQRLSRPHAQPLGRVTVQKCARQVLNNWIRDGRLRDGYRRECYRGVLDLIGDANPDTLYGASVFSEVQEKLRTSA